MGSDSRLDRIKDLTFRLDRNYNQVIVSGAARYYQIVRMLFITVPGTDEYNPNKGLNILSKLYDPRTNYERDTEYETEVSRQFSEYTDLMATNVTAMGINGAFCVLFDLHTPTGVYEILINNKTDQLTVLLNNK